MKLFPFVASTLAVLSSSAAGAQTTTPPYLKNSPLSFTGRANNVSVYSRETNRITCMAKGTRATWLGTRLGIKRVDSATGAARVFSAAEGLPWGGVHSIATDDAGIGAVALVYSTAKDGSASFFFCLYSPQSDRWQVLARLAPHRPEWFADLPQDSRDHFRNQSYSSYYIAIGERYAVIVPYLSGLEEPLVTRYECATGRTAKPVEAQIITDSDASFVATKAIVRYREALYLGTQYGLYKVDLNSGETKRHFPSLDVINVAVPTPPKSDHTALWFIARKRFPGRSHSDQWGEGFLQAFSLTEERPIGELASLKNKNFLGHIFRVGEDGHPYFVQQDISSRYESLTATWRDFYDDGKEVSSLTSDELFRRRRSIFGFDQNLPPAPATIIPDSVAVERAYSNESNGLNTDFGENPLRWIQARFSDWLSPDARASSANIDAAEQAELNELPVVEKAYRVVDPFIPRREWSANTQDAPQLWKWDTLPVPPSRVRLHAQYLLEKQGKFAREASYSIAPPGMWTKIPLKLPGLRRVQPGVTSLLTVWQKGAEGSRWSGVIVETTHGPLWLTGLESNGITHTALLASDERKRLEAIDQKPFLSPFDFPTDAPAIPFPNASGRKPLMRILKNDGGDSIYVLVTGSPNLWMYSVEKKTWAQKAVLPASARRHLAMPGKTMGDLPAAVLRREILIGDADGLWVYDGADGHDRWKHATLPVRFVPASAATTGLVAGKDILLGRVATDEKHVFIAGHGGKWKDPMVLIRWNKKTEESTFLTEDTYGIPSLHGGTPLLMGDGESVWCALQPQYTPYGSEDNVSGVYRWNEKADRFALVTGERAIAMQTDTAGDRDVYLLTRDALLRWRRKTGKTQRFALPTKQTTPVMLQTPERIYIAARDVLYVWDKKTQQTRLIADIPRIGNDARFHLVTTPKQEKALWLYDSSTAVRVVLPAPKQ